MGNQSSINGVVVIDGSSYYRFCSIGVHQLLLHIKKLACTVVYTLQQSICFVCLHVYIIACMIDVFHLSQVERERQEEVQRDNHTLLCKMQTIMKTHGYVDHRNTYIRHRRYGRLVWIHTCTHTSFDSTQPLSFLGSLMVEHLPSKQCVVCSSPT